MARDRRCRDRDFEDRLDILQKEVHRRRFLQWVCTGMAMLTARGLVPSPWAEGAARLPGKDPRERAVNGIKSLNLPPGASFTVLTIPLFVKALEDINPLMEKEMGVRIGKFIEVGHVDLHTRTQAEMVKRSGEIDIIMTQLNWLPDWASGGLAPALDPWIEKGGLDIDQWVPPMFQHTQYRGKIHGLLTDADVNNLVLRRDLMEEPKEQRAFKARYGYDLAKPDTLDQWLDQAQFFNRPEKGYYGCMEARSRQFGYRVWLPRFYSKGGGMKLFDDEVRPLFNGPEGIRATEEYIEMYKYMNPAATGWGTAQIIPAFRRGEAYSCHHFPGIVGSLERPDPGNVVAGKLDYAVFPGTKTNGRILKRSIQSAGFTHCVNAFGKKPEASYYVIQWLVSAEISTKIVANTKSVYEPFRIEHFQSPEVARKYSRRFIDEQSKNLQVACPMVSMVGSEEYHDTLDLNLQEALFKRITPKEAMARTAAAWERITEGIGRSRQKEVWRYLSQIYPTKDLPT